MKSLFDSFKESAICFLMFYGCIFVSSNCFAEVEKPLLKTRADKSLQKGLEKAISDLNLKSAASENKLAVALVDVTNKKAPRFAQINGDYMMYAASLPKLSILFGLFKKVEDGSVVLDEQIWKEAQLAARYSSNEAATDILRLIGVDFVSRLMLSSKYRFYEISNGGGLWVGKEYSQAEAWQRDPLKNLAHAATAYQVARFYYLLDSNKLLSSRWAKAFKKVLSDSAIDHMFVKGIKSNYPDATIYRKSGSWQDFYSDSALVEHDGKRYIAAALTHSKYGAQWLEALIVKMDELVN